MPVITLDSFFAKEQMKRIDLIKIDVEGFEMKVLYGATDCVERFRPVLFLELCDANLREQGSSAVELLQWLEARDYGVCDAISGEPMLSGDPRKPAFTDVVCEPRFAFW